MISYSSSITFLYYNDLEYGHQFMRDVLELSLVMDQGFAAIYQISATSYLGIVNRNDRVVPGDTLVSFNTTDVSLAWERMQTQRVVGLTPMETIVSIPLKSFFFSDEEGHRFEIQEFLDPTHRQQFLDQGVFQ